MYVLKFRFQDDSDEYEEKMDSLKEVSDFLNGFLSWSSSWTMSILERRNRY